MVHSIACFRIKISSTLNEHANNESFGISNLKIAYCTKNHGDCFTGGGGGVIRPPGPQGNFISVLSNADNFNL